MKNNFFKVIAGIVTIAALITSSTASMIFWYQIKEPRCLKKLKKL